MTAEKECCPLNQRLARITPSDDIDTKYLLHALKSPTFRRFLDELNTGSLIEHMFTSQLADAAVPVPPLLEQREIVQCAERLLDLADAVQARAERATARMEQITQALLAKAFGGELVPQDPADEPATVTLERMRTLRAAADAGQGRSRRRR